MPKAKVLPVVPQSAEEDRGYLDGLEMVGESLSSFVDKLDPFAPDKAGPKNEPQVIKTENLFIDVPPAPAISPPDQTTINNPLFDDLSLGAYFRKQHVPEPPLASAEKPSKPVLQPDIVASAITPQTIPATVMQGLLTPSEAGDFETASLNKMRKSVTDKIDDGAFDKGAQTLDTPSIMDAMGSGKEPDWMLPFTGLLEDTLDEQTRQTDILVDISESMGLMTEMAIKETFLQQTKDAEEDEGPTIDAKAPKAKLPPEPENQQKLFGGLFSSLFSNVRMGAAGLMKFFFGTSLVKGLVGLMTKVSPLALLAGAITAIWGGVETFIKNEAKEATMSGRLGDAIVGGIGQMIDFFTIGLFKKDTVTKFLEPLSEILESIFDIPFNFFAGIFNAIEGMFTEDMGPAMENLSNMGGALSRLVDGVVDMVKNIFDILPDSMQDYWGGKEGEDGTRSGGMLEQTRDAVFGGIHKSTDFIRNTYNSTTDNVGEFTDRVGERFQNNVHYLNQGMVPQMGGMPYSGVRYNEQFIPQSPPTQDVLNQLNRQENTTLHAGDMQKITDFRQDTVNYIDGAKRQEGAQAAMVAIAASTDNSQVIVNNVASVQGGSSGGMSPASGNALFNDRRSTPFGR